MRVSWGRTQQTVWRWSRLLIESDMRGPVVWAKLGSWGCPTGHVCLLTARGTKYQVFMNVSPHRLVGPRVLTRGTQSIG